MSSDFSLAFLRNLGHSYTDEDVEDLWRDRNFPLVCTADFARNWTVVPDPNGLFLTSSGSRCRVDPQPHHQKECQISIQDDFGTRKETIVYEAVIFAKIAHRLSLRKMARGRGTQPEIIEYRRFANKFASKLPGRWRDTIFQCDLHLYDEEKVQMPQSISVQLYAPLTNPENIRLLEILPNIDSYAPIQCTLREAGPPAASEYEALSYVWGQGGATRSILLNGTAFPVGENLEAALRQLRPRGNEPRAMWVDAVCIDQSNIQERTEQVSQMDSVYRNAASVEVWLGRESNTSSQIFGHLTHFRKTFEEQTEAMRSHHFFLSFPFQPVKYCPDCGDVPPVDTKVVKTAAARELEAARRNPQVLPQQWTDSYIDFIEAMDKLLNRPWWTRVWVLQELILAKKVTLHCGPESAKWIEFQILLFALIRQGKRSQIHHRGGLLRKHRKSRAHFMLLNKAHRTFPFFFLQAASFFAKTAEGLCMANLISLTHDFEATDPRDRIFALVGLLPEDSRERLAFKPDYTANVKRLFVRAAKYFIETTGRLDVITARPGLPHYYVKRPGSEVQGGGGGPLSWMDDFYHQKSQPNAQIKRGVIPTWVPDWEMPHLWPYSSVWINTFSPLATLDLYMRSSLKAQQQEANPASSTTGPAIPDTYERLQVFNASLHRQPLFAPKFSAYDEILHARGVTVDVVSEVGQPWDLAAITIPHVKYGVGASEKEKALEDMHNDQVAVIERWKSIAGLEDDGPYPFANQSRKEAFWRTLLLDRYRDSSTIRGILSFHRLPDAHDEERMAQVFASTGARFNFPPKDDVDETWLVYYIRHEATELWGFASVNLHCVNLSFFTTTKGYFGVGHPNVRPSDKVAVLLGSPVPLLLREYPEGHVLVGESYVHGIMDGETVQERMEHSKGTEEDFELFSII